MNVTQLKIFDGVAMDGRWYDIRYKEENDYASIIWGIKVDSDAIRLKKALEHLIELVKAEKSTDPFHK